MYLFDIGLLGCMLELPAQAIIEQNFGSTKGYLAENFVATELLAAFDNNLLAWSERTAEIEFITSQFGNIVPIEVKSSNKTRAKSLKVFLQKYSPKHAIKLSTNPPEFNNKQALQHMPLYLSGHIDMIL